MPKNRSVLFIITKVLCLQSLFILTSKFAPGGNELLFLFVCTGAMCINYFIVRHLIHAKHYIFMCLLFFALGFIQDTILINLNIIDMGSKYPPIWIATLWMLFFAYYGDVFNRMLYFPIWAMSILGAVGGSLAYYRGFMMMEVSFSNSFFPIVAIVWAIFMPISLIMFRNFKTMRQG